MIFISYLEKLYRGIEQALGDQNAAYLFAAVNTVLFFVGSSSMLFLQDLNFAIVLIQRGSFGSAICFAYIKAFNVDCNITKQQFNLSLKRSLFLVFNQTTFLFILNNASPSLAYTLVNVGPIIVFIMNFYMFNCKVTLKNKLGILCSFIGVIFIINSNQIIYFLTSKQNIQQQKITTLYKLSLVLFGLFAITLWAYGVIIIHKVKIHIAIANLFYSIGLLLSGTLLLPFTSQTNPTIKTFLLQLLTCGLPLGISHLLFGYITKITKNTGIVTIIGYLTSIYGFIFEWLYLGDQINIFQIIGSASILVGLYCVAF